MPPAELPFTLTLPRRTYATRVGVLLAARSTSVRDQQRSAEHGDQLAHHLVVEAHGHKRPRRDPSTLPAAPSPEATGVPVRRHPCCKASVRLIVARCSVTYEGRLGARLGPSDAGWSCCKADGSIADPLRLPKALQAAELDEPAVRDHGDATASIVAENAQGGDPAGRAARGRVDDALLRPRRGSRPREGRRRGRAAAPDRGARAGTARRPHARSAGASTRPTSVPSTCSVATATGRAVVVEVKRVGEIAGVDQLIRYQERLDLDVWLGADVRDVRRHPHQAAGAGVRREPRHRLRRGRPRRSARARHTTPEAVLTREGTHVHCTPTRRDRSHRRALRQEPQGDRRRRADVERARAVLHRRRRVHRSGLGSRRGYRTSLGVLHERMVGLEEWGFPVEVDAIDGDNVVMKWLQRLAGSVRRLRYEQSGSPRMVYAGDGKVRYRGSPEHGPRVRGHARPAAGGPAPGSRARRPSRTGTSPGR